MKKINWKIRLKNPQFLFQIALAVVVPIFAYFGIEAKDVSTWSMFANTIIDAVKNPYVLALVVVSVYNAVNDPTVAGVSDSNLVLSYDEPKADVDDRLEGSETVEAYNDRKDDE